MVPSERRSWGQRERAGDAASDVALLVRSGLRGWGGDLRPYPESNAKLLRGFKQASEVMRFAFLKDHFPCCVKSGLGGTRGYCRPERGQRGEWTNWETEGGNGQNLETGQISREKEEEGRLRVSSTSPVCCGQRWWAECMHLHIVHPCLPQHGVWMLEPTSPTRSSPWDRSVGPDCSWSPLLVCQ